MILDNETIEARLADANLAITNARDDNKIAPLLLPYGYDETRFSEGMQLYTTAFDLHQIQKTEYGEQFVATESFQQTWEAVYKTYMSHVRVARVALKGSPAQQKFLDIFGERKASYSGWLDQARQYYDNAVKIADIAAALALYGLSADILTAAAAQVENVEALRRSQAKETGDAQDATAKRDAALDTLESWVADLIAIARVAVTDTPQLLEKLGVKVSP